MKALQSLAVISSTGSPLHLSCWVQIRFQVGSWTQAYGSNIARRLNQDVDQDQVDQLIGYCFAGAVPVLPSGFLHRQFSG